MKRSSQQSHRARVVMFEALQPRELMAVDAFSVADREGYRPYLPKVTAEQWADRILNNYEFSRSVQQDQSLADLKKFDSEQDAKKFLTDALLKTWQDVLGKPVNDKLNAGYIDYYLGPFFSTSGVLRSQNDDSLVPS